MAARLLRDPDTDGWERSDMPIVCETCLGPNPFVRMQRVCDCMLLKRENSMQKSHMHHLVVERDGFRRLQVTPLP